MIVVRRPLSIASVALIAWGMAFVVPLKTGVAAGVFDSALFQLINQDRTQNGVAPLDWSGTLSGIGESTPYAGCGYAIGGRAEDMIQRQYFSHQILNCGTQTVVNILQADGVGYASAGENIAWESRITDPWQAASYINAIEMNSPEHRANILNPSYNQLGVGSWTAATWMSYSNVTMSTEEFIQSPGGSPPVLPPVWQAPALLGGAPAGHPHAISWGPGNSDVFWMGSDRGLWHMWYSGGWHGPQSLGGARTMASDPYPVSWGAGHIDVFWKGTGGNLWHSWYLGGWYGPQNLGQGPLGSAPHAVSWGQGMIDVFWRGTDNGLWHAYYVGGWHGPQPLPGRGLVTDPYPASWGPGNIDVFWKDGGGNLVHDWYGGSWSGSQVLGDGPLGSAPHPVSPTPGVISVFWRGTDGQLWRAWYTLGWHGPEAWGGAVSSDPSPVATGVGTIEVAWNDSGGGLSTATANLGRHVLQSLGGGPFTSPPSA